ncbi:MAG: hypothetical protein K8F30_05585 [Taibaiella sp.]|nr:hypothetical protein [Taibaiella sp.]
MSSTIFIAMDGIILLITLASIATPILLTYLYRRTLSPAKAHERFSQLPSGYKAILVISAILPVAGAAGMDVVEDIVDIDELWFVLFPAAIIMCAIVTDAILLWARRSKWALLFAVPYIAISALSVAVIIYMLIMTLDKHPRMF